MQTHPSAVTTRPKGLLNIPELTQPNSDSFDTRPKKINVWLSDLPMGDVGEYARRIYHALKQINRMEIPSKDRLRVIQLLTPHLLEATHTLSRHYDSQMLPIPEKDQKIATLCMELYSEQALGYKILIDEVWSKKLNVLNVKSTANLIYRAIYYLYQVLLAAYEIYTDPPPNTWLHIHQLYMYSEDNQLTQFIPRDLDAKGPMPPNSIGELYTQTLLLGLLSPFRLRQIDTKKVVTALKDWSKHCKILPADQYHDNTGYVLIKQNSDYAPGYYFVDSTINHVYTRTLDSTDLVNHISDLVVSQPSRIEQNTRIYDLPADVIRLLIITWSGKSKRLFSRTSKDNQLTISAGINATHFMVGNMQKANSVLAEKGVYYALIESVAADKVPDFGELMEKDELQNNSRAQFETAPLFGIGSINSAGSDVWDDDFTNKSLGQSYNLKLYQQGKAALTPTDRSFHAVHCDTINESANGYCLFGNLKDEANPTKVQVGELIGIRNDKVKKDKAIDIGVIRRLKSTEKGIEFGIQKIAPSADAVAICLYHQRNIQGKHQRALLLPAMKSRRQPITLVAGKSFNIGDEILINKLGFQTKIHLTKIIETTGEFNQFEFDVQKVIGLASEQKAEASKNFDSVWTLI